jgi:hypothetical protein
MYVVETKKHKGLRKHETLLLQTHTHMRLNVTSKDGLITQLRRKSPGVRF